MVILEYSIIKGDPLLLSFGHFDEEEQEEYKSNESLVFVETISVIATPSQRTFRQCNDCPRMANETVYGQSTEKCC